MTNPEILGEEYNERLQQVKDEINATIRVGERICIWYTKGDDGRYMEGTITECAEHDFAVKLENG